MCCDQGVTEVGQRLTVYGTEWLHYLAVPLQNELKIHFDWKVVGKNIFRSTFLWFWPSKSIEYWNKEAASTFSLSTERKQKSCWWSDQLVLHLGMRVVMTLQVSCISVCLHDWLIEILRNLSISRNIRKRALRFYWIIFSLQVLSSLAGSTIQGSDSKD